MVGSSGGAETAEGGRLSMLRRGNISMLMQPPVTRALAWLGLGLGLGLSLAWMRQK